MTNHEKHARDPIDEATLRRIRAAAHDAAVNRFELEFVWPECHKPKCKEQHGEAGQALALLEHAVIESIENELRFETVTRPDVAEPEDTAEQDAVLTLATLLSTYNVRDASTFVRAAQLMIDAYPALIEALLPGDDDWEYGVQYQEGGLVHDRLGLSDAMEDAEDGTVLRRRPAGPWEPVEEVPREG